MIFNTLRGKQTRHLSQTIPERYLTPQSLTGSIAVTEGTTLSIPAAYRCVQLISDTIGSLPIGAYRDDQRLDPTPSILKQPDPNFTRMDTFSAAVSSLILRGNAYFLLGGYDRLGFPTQAVLLSPDATNVQMLANGTIIYHVAGNQYDASDILHVRGGIVSAGSLMGAGPLQLQRRTLGLAIAGDESASEMHVNGSIPSGVISSQNELSQEEAVELKNSFLKAHGGRQKSPAVLSGGLTYQPLSFSPDDLQLLESRKFSAEQICTIFGVPPHMVGVPTDGNSKTYSNVQQDNRAFVTYTLRGYMSRLEQAFSSLLPRGQVALFDADDFQRADRRERFEAHKIGIESGFLSINEVRRLEDLPEDETNIEIEVEE
jgi:HK97 family phage portal protein